jgi:cation transport ATPase
VGRRSRKRTGTQTGGTATTAAAPQPAETTAAAAEEARPMSRSERRNAETRAKLVPLEPGERPLAVTIAAIVAVALAAANLIAFAVGAEIDGERAPVWQVVAFAAIMLVAAWGMWQVKYWAVLAFQALLGIFIILVAIQATVASNLLALVVVIALVVPAGTLFWFLIRAMARIQMPERR